ncbi:hypothetical protein EW146_g5121 [Bondarzewia mesenterica]|uniref:Uncharacterized protein n=1 Tax=Bondarzewia mesenterica TaxID=1095465 RepID=A0A4S4LT26_9AGAM|nr:hypothetical protein EW146_g5121 [Bondarzewia mesenterica]
MVVVLRHSHITPWQLVVILRSISFFHPFIDLWLTWSQKSRCKLLFIWFEASAFIVQHLTIIRPLPDERPRQSVANLIGRFEQQTKRQSTSNGTPRPSSIISDITGDSVREEIKASREWPPVKTTSLSTPFKSSSPPSSILRTNAFSPPPSHSSQASPTSDAKAPSAARSDPATSDDVPLNAAQSNSAPAGATATTVTAPTPRPAGTGPRQSAPAKTAITNNRSLPTSSSKPATGRASVAIPTPKTPSKTASKVSASTPSKPSHPPAAAAAKFPPPTSHARPKTPSVNRPAIARPKTPSTALSAGIVRPRTPASGLFAPTAASLAKSRNAPPAHPSTPAKKVVPNLDRLSKPTAASAGKARAPAAVLAVTKPKAAPGKKGTAATTVGKSAAGAGRGAAPAKMSAPASEDQKTKATDSVASGAAAVAVAGLAASAIAAEEAEVAPSEESEAQIGHELELSGSSAEVHEDDHEEPQNHEAEAVEEPEASLEEQETGHVELGAEEVHAEEPADESEAHAEHKEPVEEHEVHAEESQLEPEKEDEVAVTAEEPEPELLEHEAGPELKVMEQEPEVAALEPEVTLSERTSEDSELPSTAVLYPEPKELVSLDLASNLHHSSDADAVPNQEERLDEVKTRHKGDDLEDIVNMLQGPAAMPMPVAFPADAFVAGEIPDDE